MNLNDVVEANNGKTIVQQLIAIGTGPCHENLGWRNPHLFGVCDFDSLAIRDLDFEWLKRPNSQSVKNWLWGEHEKAPNTGQVMILSPDHRRPTSDDRGTCRTNSTCFLAGARCVAVLEAVDKSIKSGKWEKVEVVE